MGNNIYQILDQLGIPFQKHEHPPVHTVEEANRYRGQLPGGRTKNLFLRNKKGDRHYLVVVEAEKQVDLRQLRALVGERALSFASPSRLEKHLGLTPGSVTPFGIINDREKGVVVVLDRDLMRHEDLNFHPNVNTATLTISREDFRRFLEYCGNLVRIVELTPRPGDEHHVVISPRS